MIRATISGRLTGDPITRETGSGRQLGAFSVASNRRWKNADGSDGESVTFINCVAFQENFPANLAASLHKGDYINVTGVLEADNYTSTIEVDGVSMQRQVQSVKCRVDTVGPDLRFQSAPVTRNEQATGAAGVERALDAELAALEAETASEPV